MANGGLRMANGAICAGHGISTKGFAAEVGDVRKGLFSEVVGKIGIFNETEHRVGECLGVLLRYLESGDAIDDQILGASGFSGADDWASACHGFIAYKSPFLEYAGHHEAFAEGVEGGVFVDLAKAIEMHGGFVWIEFNHVLCVVDD